MLGSLLGRRPRPLRVAAAGLRDPTQRRLVVPKHQRPAKARLLSGNSFGFLWILESDYITIKPKKYTLYPQGLLKSLEPSKLHGGLLR